MQKKTSADTRFLILLAAQGLTLALLILSVISSTSVRNDSERARLTRDTAAKLQAAGLALEAIRQYEEYLREPGIPSRTRASVSYLLAQMYESQGQPEKALVWYYQVEGSDPNAPEQKEAAKQIVALLESLGKHQAAKSVLSGATALGSDKKNATGTVVAEVGGRKVLLEEIDSAMDALPDAVKQSFDGKEGKKQFLKKFIADELLYEKAKRLQYDSDPKWLKQLEEAKRQSLVSRVIGEEVLSKVAVDEKDLKNFFEANKARYTQNKKTPPFDKVRAAVEQDYRMEKSQAKYQELVEKLVAADNIKLFPENVK